MTSHASHKQYDDQSDEPLDPVEGADSGFAQTVGEELRQATTNVGERELVEGQIVELDDLQPEPPAEAAAPSALEQLKALAARGKAAKAMGANTDPFAALLSRVRAKVEEGDQIKADRKLLSSSLDAGGLTGAQRIALREKLLKWEAEVEWKPAAVLQVIERQTCSICKAVHPSSYGLFQVQTRRVSEFDAREGKRPADRLIRWSPEDLSDPALASLPKQLAFRDRTVSACIDCLESQAFVTVQINWEQLDVAVRVVGGEPARTILKGRPAGETQPKSPPVQVPPPGKLTDEEDAEVSRIYSKSLGHAGWKSRDDVSLAERERLNDLLEKANLGRSDLPGERGKS